MKYHRADPHPRRRLDWCAECDGPLPPGAFDGETQVIFCSPACAAAARAGSPPTEAEIAERAAAIRQRTWTEATHRHRAYGTSEAEQRDTGWSVPTAQTSNLPEDERLRS